MKQYLIIYLIAFFVLFVRLSLFYSSPNPYRVGEVITIKTTLLSEPTVKGDYQSFTTFANGHVRVYVKVASSEQLHYGDSLILRGVLDTLQIGEKELLLLDKPELIKQTPSRLISTLATFRTLSTKLYREVLSADQAGLLLGIVYGIKSPLSYRFSQAIQSVGLTHVSAASGMNVTLLASFLGIVLIPFMKRQKTVCVIIAFLITYMILSGMQGSILRATLMGGSAIIAGIFGRQRQGVYLLFLSAYILLFISPVLLQDLGFQLSFLSTLGILLFSPLVENLVAGRILLEDLATSWCAQIFTLPLLLTIFGNYNLLSLLVNMLVLWVVAPLMILGGLASICGIFVPALSTLLLALCIPLLWYFQSVTLFFAKFETTVQIEQIAPAFIIAYYCLVIGGYLFWKQKKKSLAEF